MYLTFEYHFLPLPFEIKDDYTPIVYHPSAAASMDYGRYCMLAMIYDNSGCTKVVYSGIWGLASGIFVRNKLHFIQVLQHRAGRSLQERHHVSISSAVIR